jgi:hypothetical protein
MGRRQIGQSLCKEVSSQRCMQMDPKTWEQGSMEAFSIKPSGRVRLNRPLHIVQLAGSSLPFGSRTGGYGDVCSNATSALGMRFNASLSIVAKRCVCFGIYMYKYKYGIYNKTSPQKANFPLTLISTTHASTIVSPHPSNTYS